MPQWSMVDDFSLNIFINLQFIGKSNLQNKLHRYWKSNKKVKSQLTFSPLSMYLTATSSLVCLSLISLATPKFPAPISRTSSYLSLSCMIGTSIPGPTVTAVRSIVQHNLSLFLTWTSYLSHYYNPPKSVSIKKSQHKTNKKKDKLLFKLMKNHWIKSVTWSKLNHRIEYSW